MQRPEMAKNLQALQNQLIAVLRRAGGLLDITTQSELKAEVIEGCDRIHSPTSRVAIFGPFNYGKSTLLNALLGEKTLPMDLVPTTGAAITVKYGPLHRTVVTYADGSVQTEAGVTGLKEVAVLDEQRRMRIDVRVVEVYCPHPLLKLGLELIDLPGTDDTAAQNELVKKQLLSADLVIQVLDGRKVMTLAERENLRDWLLDRGINTVIFVVNFLNLMESADRQQVSVRLRFLAESFRANLPDGVSNLYQVDALPALRARLKGDAIAAAQTGLPALESALQTIGQQASEGKPLEQTLPRLKAIAQSVTLALQTQLDTLCTPQPDAADSQRVEIKKKAQSLIQKGFDQDVAKLRTWLTPKNLQAHYRLGLAQALENNTDQNWLWQNLRPAWSLRQKSMVAWVHQACEFFNQVKPSEVAIAFDQLNNAADRTEAGVDYAQRADRYLAQFSAAALSAIAQYETQATPIIQTKIAPLVAKISPAQAAQINLIKTILSELNGLISQAATQL
ncbi:MAG: dynamin family protein [Phormidesmis sp.]